MGADELIREACREAGLPNVAQEQIPESLSDETKKMILKLSVDELAVVLKRVVDEIDQGSVETIEKLMKMALHLRKK